MEHAFHAPSMSSQSEDRLSPSPSLVFLPDFFFSVVYRSTTPINCARAALTSWMRLSDAVLVMGSPSK